MSLSNKNIISHFSISSSSDNNRTIMIRFDHLDHFDSIGLSVKENEEVESMTFSVFFGDQPEPDVLTTIVYDKVNNEYLLTDGESDEVRVLE